MSEWTEVTDSAPRSTSTWLNPAGYDRGQYIELDCAPGLPRPGDLIDGVIDGLGLPDRPAKTKFMGNWIWDYTDVDPAVWAAAKLQLGERIADLHSRRLIRYGSW